MINYLTINPKRNLEIIKEVFEIIGAFEAFIAGGFARHSITDAPEDYYSDIDIYSRSLKKYEMMEEVFKSKFKIIKESEVSITFDNKYSIIKPVLGFYGTPEQVLNTFDFTICQAAIINPETCLYNSSFYEDHKNKRLILYCTNYPINTFFRVIKYTKKGYFISPLEVLKIFNAYHMLPEEVSILTSEALLQEKIFTKEIIQYHKTQIKNAILKTLKTPGKS